jgi:hypothetical protein
LRALCCVWLYGVYLRVDTAAYGHNNGHQPTLQESATSNHSIHQRKNALAILDTKRARSVVCGNHLIFLQLQHHRCEERKATLNVEA